MVLLRRDDGTDLELMRRFYLKHGLEVVRSKGLAWVRRLPISGCCARKRRRRLKAKGRADRWGEKHPSLT